jgi:Holliday junction resolvasome RuvABC endonuclease subunit
MVTLMLKPPHKLAADEADALAVALTHANTLLLNDRLKSMGGGR